MRRSYPFFASAVRCEVVHRDFDAFSLLQLPEDGDQQLKVKGIRVVEVIFIFGCELLLFFIQHLTHRHSSIAQVKHARFRTKDSSFHFIYTSSDGRHCC